MCTSFSSWQEITKGFKLRFSLSIEVAMEALRVGISLSPGIGNKAILPRNIMRIPAMSRILRSSNLLWKNNSIYISKQCDFSKQTFCIMVPQRQIETPPSGRQPKSKFQNIKLFSLQSIQNDPCIKVYLTFKSMRLNFYITSKQMYMPNTHIYLIKKQTSIFFIK